MPEIGVRELKARASEIVRAVRDQRVRYTVTYRGRPVGVLIPLGEASREAAGESDAWDDVARLGQLIAEGWHESKTSAELLSEMRR